MALAVAVAIFQGDDRRRVLLVRRPDDPAEEHPGLWGLPAVTLRPGETPQEGVQRAGQQKLGLALRPRLLLAHGQQLRPGGVLQMLLFEAEALSWPPRLQPQAREEGVTYYSDWTWGEPELVVPAAVMGSLCSRLLLDALGDYWRP
jgi:8-oxo-dGTP diphosphatase